MSSKGPLEGFYRDCLRLGSLKASGVACRSTATAASRHAGSTSPETALINTLVATRCSYASDDACLTPSINRNFSSPLLPSPVLCTLQPVPQGS